MCLPTHLGDARSYLGDLLYVAQKDLLIAGDRGGAVVIHQLVQGVKLYHPQEVLSCAVTEDLEVLNIISKPAGGEEEENREELRLSLREIMTYGK